MKIRALELAQLAAQIMVAKPGLRIEQAVALAWELVEECRRFLEAKKQAPEGLVGESVMEELPAAPAPAPAPEAPVAGPAETISGVS